ncbi:hypothetical protein JVU11DRAFT_796 [Chiua virens]|nr:hypothetical protein JVU11DRAFT_796 [Chiua virens]
MEASQSSSSNSNPGQFSQDAQTPMRRPSAYPRPLISTFGWELQSIVASSPNFRHIERVHYTSPNANVDLVIKEFERSGKPMIINGWNRHPRWPRSMFNIEWLKTNGDQNPTVRNVHNWTDFKLPLDEFIKKLHDCPVYACADEQERLYGKDGECPTEWTEWLTQTGVIPNELLFYGSNDFLKFLPDKAKVQTLMCYMGIGDTFTPFHKDLCASSGHNLMCFSEHSGSAFWFMTESSAAPRVTAYFHQLGQEIDLETHVVTIEELANAPFEVYIAEQQLGDLVLVPPRSCHQVVNKGGITIKTSWSRMSLYGLQIALWHELPIYHRVCRPEIYKVKSNIYHALQHFTRITQDLPERFEDAPCITTDNLKHLVSLFDDILAAEFSVARDSMPHVSQSNLLHTDNLHCDFCGSDIFQSFFECDKCLPAASSGSSAGILPVGDGLTLCPLCYAEGRICHCGEMQPVQCRPFNDLLRIRDQAVMAIQRMEVGYVNAHGNLLGQPDRLLSVGDANIFEATYKLSQKRKADAKVSKSCRVVRAAPHQVPTAVYCRKCHHSECYTHLLELHSVHSVDAIARSDRQDGEEDWHQYHRSCSRQYPEIRRGVIEDQERGSRPNTLHQLTYLAKTFTTCRAIAIEVTNYGWYDRFAQATSIPVVNTPAKALLTLPDPIDDDEPCDDHTSNDSPYSPATPTRNVQRINSRRASASPNVARPTSPEGIISDQRRQADLSVIRDSRSPTVDPVSPLPESTTVQAFDSTASASTQTQLGTSVIDDLGNLSDLTDLPNEFDSPLHNTITAIPISETSVVLSFPSSSAPVPSSDTLLLTGSKLKSRLVFDCVEIPHPKWHGKTEKISSPPQPKRKRIAAPSPSNVAGSSDSDSTPSAVQESKRKKKSRGPASR